MYMYFISHGIHGICTFPVTTETKLEDWNIALIVIGVTAYIIGVCVATVLGTSLFLRASTHCGGLYLYVYFFK